MEGLDPILRRVHELCPPLSGSQASRRECKTNSSTADFATAQSFPAWEPIAALPSDSKPSLAHFRMNREK